MSKASLTLALGIGLAWLPGCDGATAPDGSLPADDFELPAPDTSLDPDRLSVGEYIATPCALGIHGSGLDHLRDRHEWALVDVFFGHDSPEGPRDGPTFRDVRLVRAHDGRVLHTFDVPAVRARMLLSRIPGLVEEGRWVSVRDVPDATRYDVEVSVGFTRALEESDVELFGELGGRVTHRWEFIDALAGILPDRSIAALRSRPDVGWVEGDGVLCVGSEGEEPPP